MPGLSAMTGLSGLSAIFGGGLDYASYVQTFVDAGTLPLWYQMSEAAGAVINYGSSGAVLNGTNSNCTPGQTSPLGASTAYLFNGTTSYIDVPSHASINNMTSFSVAALVNPTDFGEASTGILYSSNGADDWCRLENFSTLDAYWIWRNTDATDATSTPPASAGQHPPFGAWSWWFITYDHTGDRRIDTYKGVAAGVTEYAYNLHVPATGNLIAWAGLRIGNRSTSRTWNGYIGHFLIFNTVLSAAQMEAITSLTPF